MRYALTEFVTPAGERNAADQRHAAYLEDSGLGQGGARPLLSHEPATHTPFAGLRRKPGWLPLAS